MPSSRFLAQAMCRPLANVPRPARFLEVGPGTGAFTGKMIAQLAPGDHLVLVEINARFVKLLRGRLEEDRKWRPRRHQVEVRLGSALDLPADERYGGIVCGLPFNNFPPKMVRQLLDGLLARLEPGGTLSFFEYWALRKARTLVASPTERRRLYRLTNSIDRAKRSGPSRAEVIVYNIPPAKVHHIERTD